jgi:WD40 repeat protein
MRGDRALQFWLPALLFLVIPGETLTSRAGGAEPSPSNTPRQPKRVVIPRQPPGVSSGKPLSSRTLVARPAIIPGVMSWTLETRRHRGSLFCIAVSPDGRRLATGGIDGIVRLWDVPSGRFVRALVGHESYVYDLAWSPDGKILGVACRQVGVRLVDASTAKIVHSFGKPTEDGYGVAWSPDGKTVATGSPTQTQLWQAGSWRPLRTLAGQGAYLAWCPDNKRLLAAPSGGAVQVWDAGNGKAVKTLPAAASYF